MIARAPFRDAAGRLRQAFKTDNHMTWNHLSQAFAKTEAWSIIKQYQAKRDGRKAYLAITNHYLGPNISVTQSEKANAALDRSTYTGEKRNWNLEKHIAHHIQQHEILNDLKEREGFSGIAEVDKVSKLMKSIRYPPLEQCKIAIRSNPELKTDFKKAARVFQDYINAEVSERRANVQIAAATLTRTPGEIVDGYKQGDPIPSFPTKEYKTLTFSQKKRLREIREENGVGGNKKRKFNNKKKNKKEEARMIASIALKVAKHMKEEKDNDDDDESVEYNDKKETSNRNHPALRRK